MSLSDHLSQQMFCVPLWAGLQIFCDTQNEAVPVGFPCAPKEHLVVIPPISLGNPVLFPGVKLSVEFVGVGPRCGSSSHLESCF